MKADGFDRICESCGFMLTLFKLPLSGERFILWKELPPVWVNPNSRLYAIPLGADRTRLLDRLQIWTAP